MVAIPIPVSSSPGMRAQEGAGRLINCFAEKTEQGARFPVIWRRSAGLRQQVEAGHVHLRGAILNASTLLCAFDQRVYAVTLSGVTFTATNLGALTGTGPVTIAKNNAATPNVVCVTTDGAFNLFDGSAPTNYSDSDVGQPNSVAELNGYFLFTYGDGRIVASDLNSTVISSSSFTTEQSLGGLLRGTSFRGEYFAFGPVGIGVYGDVGASPFPLARKFSIEKGIIGTHAVAGWEIGWIGQLIWVGQDGIVYQLNGYTPQPISNDDVTRAIVQAIADGQGTALEASVYMQGKHAFWRLTNPGVWTWDYNATTQNWNERQSYGRDDCRASCSVWAFDRWLIGDRETGKLFKIDETYYREADDALVFEIVSGVLANFPARMAIPRVDIDLTSAVGEATGDDPTQADPSAQISWSLDGGYSYGNPVLRKIGAQGESGKTVTVQRIGLAKGKGVRFKIRVSDPVHVGLMGIQIPVELRAAA